MAAIQKSYSKEDFIFQEGDPPSSIYIIKKGFVSIRKRKGSSYVEVAKLYQNEVLGEMAFFDRKPRSATAVAGADLELLEIGFDTLDKSYDQLPDYLKSIISAVVERLRKANGTIRKLEEAHVKGRANQPDDTMTDEELLAAMNLEEDPDSSKS